MWQRMAAHKYALMVAIPAILLGGLALGWAVGQPDLSALPDDPEYFENLDSYRTFSDSHLEGEYGDCALGIEAVGGFGANATASIDLACNYYLGGGGGGGGSDERHEYPSLHNFDHDHIRDYTNWKQDGIESCTMQAYNFLRHQESGPNTISVLINCWWFEDKERTVIESSLPELTPEFLANSTSHALLGVVTQINSVPVQYDEAGVQQVFTDVVIAVNEDLKGEYLDALITVRVDGGETDTGIVIHESAPRFKVGEMVFIFVGDKEPESIYGDNYHVAGQYQGKYSIQESGFAVNQDPGRSTTLDELRAIVGAALSGDGN